MHSDQRAGVDAHTPRHQCGACSTRASTASSITIAPSASIISKRGRPSDQIWLRRKVCQFASPAKTAIASAIVPARKKTHPAQASMKTVAIDAQVRIGDGTTAP